MIFAQNGVPNDIEIRPAPPRGVFLAGQMITPAVLNGNGPLPLS
jgi:hypothetical protein